MIWLWLIACSSGTDTGDTETEVEILEWSYNIKPKKLDFGDQTVGTPFTKVISVQNTGEADLLFLDFDAPTAEGLHVTAPASFSLPPGSAQDLMVTWTPGSASPMADEFSLVLGASTSETETVTVPLKGSGQGPVMTISSQKYEFGGVPVGCYDEIIFTLTNTGNADLQIEGLGLDGDTVYTLTPDTLDEPLPWTVAPFTSRDIGVRYTPVEQNYDVGVVELTSDAGEVSAALTGEGVVDGSNVLTYTVGEQNKNTVLVHVNEVAIEGPYGSFAQVFEDYMTVFFETLQDNRADYRAAFFWSVDGTVDGTVPYLDSSYSPEQSKQIVLDAIAGGSTAGDNDRNFTSLLNAVEENRWWLFDDGGWEDSKLSLVAINRDTEQSGGHYSQYVEQAQALKSDPEKVVFHAIAGPYPSGCGVAEPFTSFKEAVDETGGVFLTICDIDWTSNMEQLAAATLDGADFFPLTGSPLVSTIAVSLDDIPTSTGWEYDESLNAIVFAEDTYPRAGTIVEIYYLKSDGCG
jgi:hypothetical protein